MTDFEKVLIRVQYSDVLIVYDDLQEATYYYKCFIDLCNQNKIDCITNYNRRELIIGDYMIKFVGDIGIRRIKGFRGEVIYDAYF